MRLLPPGVRVARRNEKLRSTYITRKLAGVCTRCGGPIEAERNEAGLQQCLAHATERAERDAKRHREVYMQRKLAGVCTRCGRPVDGDEMKCRGCKQ